MFLATELELQAAAELIARCEQDLGERPLRSNRIDLICDNRCDDEHEWSFDKCKEVADRLFNDTWGVAAFHMAEARQKFPMRSKRA
jgi:hypothetical protein